MFPKQCQAIVVGFLASVAAVVMGWIPEGHFDLLHALLLCAAALVTASLASLILSKYQIASCDSCTMYNHLTHSRVVLDRELVVRHKAVINTVVCKQEK